MQAPPGTAVYAATHRGWTVSDHLLTDAIEVLDHLLWAKTTDAQQKTPKHKPKRRPRPGLDAVKQKPEDKPMTVADYLAKTGIVVNMEGRE